MNWLTLEITFYKYSIIAIMEVILLRNNSKIQIRCCKRWIGKYSTCHTLGKSGCSQFILTKICGNQYCERCNKQRFDIDIEIKLASDQSSIVYILSIPITSVNSCKKILVRPIKFVKYVNRITFQKTYLYAIM